MRQSARLTSLALVLAVSLSESGTAQERDRIRAIRGRQVMPVRTGIVDMDRAAEWDRILGPFRDEITRRARRPPRRLPEMPLPKGWERPPAPDWAPAASVFDMPLSPLPLPSRDFPGVGDINTFIPPDTHGAVGPTKVMTTLNTQVQVQDRAGTVVSGPATLGNFWAGVATASVFDPRVHYDPDPAYGGRWIWAAVQGAESPLSGLLVAASADAEPVRGPGALFDADLANAVWADYPTVGFNRNWVVVQVNMFGMPPTYPFVRSQVYVFRKDQLYAGTLTPIVFSLETACSGSCGGTQVPALTYDFAENNLYLVQRWNSGAGALRLYQISGPAATPTITPLLPLVFGPPWADMEPTFTGANFAPQGPGCGTDKIQTNDSRIQNVVWRNGRLWTTHTVFLTGPDRASVQWWEIQPNSTVAQRGLIDDPSVGGSFYAFPSIAVNQFDDVLLGFSSFAPDEFASARYAFRLANDPWGTMQQPVLLKAGEDCYFKDYATGKNRWGDFSATVVDPVDDTTMWTLQEYAETPFGGADRWGTWWGAVAPPVISIADASVAEGNAGTTALTFNLALSVQTSETVTVQWTTADDTATDLDNDYEPAGGTVSFPPLATTATIQVPVNGDTKHEPNERFFVNLSSPQYATLPDAQAVGTILNDEPDPQMSIGDAQVVEGNSGTTNAVFTVTLSYPSSGTVSATWTIIPGSAVEISDYLTGGGTVVFAAGLVTQPVTVQVVGDSLPEPDETFTVALSLPVGATLLKSVGNGVILNDDQTVSHPPVSGLVVVSDGDASIGRNRLQWINPLITPAPQGVRINFTSGPTSCSAPASPGPEPFNSPPANAIDVPLVPADAGKPWSAPHNGLSLDTSYCYAVWAWYGLSNWSTSTAAVGRPFNATGKIKWKYFIGMTTLAHPTVGTDTVLAPSNDNYVHAMTPGPFPAGGGWPASWVPVNLGSPAQTRSPIVPLGGVSRAFYTTQDGWVHAIDAATGERLWDVRIGTSLPIAGQAAPAGIFVAFGGAWNYLLVGTRMDAGNKFYALDPITGGVIDAFPQGTELGVSGLGMINGMAAVDYPGRRVYFGSLRGTAPDAPETLWCLKLGPPSDALSLDWKTGAPGPIEGSPVLRGTRLYVGDMDGKVWSLPMDGSNGYSLDLVDGAVKGFPFPDRRNSDLFVATQTKVWGLTDTVGTSLGYKWTNPVLVDSPSIVLLKPGTNDLYVGVRDIAPPGGPDLAGLLRIDISLSDPGPSVATLELEDSAVIVGPPSLDIRFNPNMIYVGSVSGVIYAVEASF